VDTVVSSELIYNQKVINDSEERGYKNSSEFVGNDDGDIVYHCAWTNRESCEDSGCMSDLSSGAGDSPSATASPPQSLINDSSLNDQASEDDTLTQNLNELDLDRNDDDDKQRDIAGDCVQRPVPITIPVQTGVGAPSVPRYIRPMREIPPRFRRLLAAEAERVVRLCQRLNGSPLYSAATPGDGASTNVDSHATSSDVNRNNDAVYVDKPLAGQTSYTSQSPLIYVTAQSSGMPVYPPASGISVPLTSYSHVSGVEPTSYVVPIGVPDAPLQRCSNAPCPAAQEALPPSVPMLYANPVYYYPNATLSPPDVGSAFSYVVQTPVVSGCPQPGTVETGSLQSGYARNANSDVNVAADAAAVGVYQSATNEGCASYCYHSPCHELPPYCSLQMMQA